MPKVGIVMGSDSDMKVMGKAATVSLMYSMNMRSLQKQKTSK